MITQAFNLFLLFGIPVLWLSSLLYYWAFEKGHLDIEDEDVSETLENLSIETDAGKASSIKDLLSDNFLDPDSPDPALFPQGILLWNTRRSGYNVKEYKNNHINTTTYPGSGSSGLGNIRFSNESVAGYYPDRWVTKSSNNADGSGSFGRKSIFVLYL